MPQFDAAVCPFYTPITNPRKLVGDRDTALTIAASALAESTPNTTTDIIRSQYGSRTLSRADVLGLRAMCYGLGIIGDDRAAALLKHVVGWDRFTTEAAARGLRMCGDDSLIEPLLEIVEKAAPDDPSLTAMALQGLMALMDVDGMDRLRLRFVSRTTITWPQSLRGGGLQRSLDRVPIYRYKIVAHPFLFEVMVPVEINYRQ